MSVGTSNTNRMKIQKSVIWRLPLKPKLENQNIDTMLLNHPDPGQYINNLYELPSTGHTFKYLHACTRFPTKSTFLKSIKLINYNTWTGLTIKATHFFQKQRKPRKDIYDKQEKE